MGHSQKLEPLVFVPTGGGGGSGLTTWKSPLTYGAPLSFAFFFTSSVPRNMCRRRRLSPFAILSYLSPPLLISSLSLLALSPGSLLSDRPTDRLAYLLKHHITGFFPFLPPFFGGRCVSSSPRWRYKAE